MNTMQTALALMKADYVNTAASFTACGNLKATALAVVSAALTGTYESQGYYEGKAFASLGVVLLGVSTLLHLLTLLRCGGDAQHPEKGMAVRKPVHVALTVSTTV